MLTLGSAAVGGMIFWSIMRVFRRDLCRTLGESLYYIPAFLTVRLILAFMLSETSPFVSALLSTAGWALAIISLNLVTKSVEKKEIIQKLVSSPEPEGFIADTPPLKGEWVNPPSHHEHPHP